MKLLVLCLVLSLAVSSLAQLNLLANLNHFGNGDSFPSGFVAGNGNLFFAATSSSTGRELYSFNTTSGLVTLVADINSGIGDGVPAGEGYVAGVGAASSNTPNPVVVFAAYNTTVGTELWVSTGASASLVADIYPGNRSSDPAQLTQVGSAVYFVATSNKVGREVFRYTFSSSGNSLLAIDIFKGAATRTAAPPSSNPDSLTLLTSSGVAKGVYFTAYTADNGRELYFISAGSGSASLIDINKGAGGSFPSQLTNIGNGKFYVQATNPTTGTDVFSVSTTTATAVDANPGAGSSYANYFVASPFQQETNLVYFSAYTPAVGYEVFVTDGSSNKLNTKVKFDINAGPADSFPSFLTAANSNIYLQYTDANGNIILSYFNNATVLPGLPQIATSVQSYQPVTGSSGGVNNNKFAYVNGSLFFYGFDNTNGRELRFISAKAPTTLNTINVNALTGRSSLLQTDDFTPVVSAFDATTFYYSAAFGRRGYEPVKVTVNAAAGTASATLLDDVCKGADGNSFAGRNGVVKTGGRTQFPANGGSQGVESFFTTGNKIKIVKNNQAGADSSYPDNFVSYGTGFAWSATTQTTGREVFVETIKLATHTRTFSSIQVVSGTASSNPTSIVNFQGDLYFSAFAPSTGYELYTISGKKASLVADIFPGNGSSFPADLIVFNDLLFFSAAGNGSGVELWYSDGTAEGTAQAADINPGAGSSNPSNFVATSTLALGPLLYFTANDGSTGIELWVTDSLSVKQVADINTGAGDSTPEQFVFFKNLLFFVARDTVVGAEVRALAPQSTFFLTGAISDIALGVADSDIQSLTIFGRSLFFGATEPTNGSEVYQSRGTKASTRLFSDVSKGERSSNPRNFVAQGGKLYFSADDINAGIEVFVANTASKARNATVYVNLNGAASSYPVIHTNGHHLLVSAYTAATGYELYAT